MELETSLRTEVEFKLRGILSIPPQFICDVVCFNRFSDDLMRAAYNPFDPPIVNIKISIRECTGWLDSHVEGIELSELQEKKEDIFHLTAVAGSTSAVCVCVCWGRGSKAGREMRGQRLIWDSVGEKEGTAKKGAGDRERERQRVSKTLGTNVCVCGRETIHCWTAGKRESARRTADRFLP